MGTWLAFPATKSNSVEIPYINYKNLRYTFDKFTEKIDGRVLVPSPMLSLVISSASLTIFFWNFPQQSPCCTGQATRSIDEENCWFAFYSVLETVFRLWGALVTHFANHQNDAKAAGFFKKRPQVQNVVTMYYLMDVIPWLTQLPYLPLYNADFFLWN